MNIGPVNPEIIGVQEIIKKRKMMPAKTYNLPGTFAGRAK